MADDILKRKRNATFDLTGESVNDILKEHSVGTPDLDLKEIARVLHEWAVRFNEGFDLALPTPAIRLDQIGRWYFAIRLGCTA